MRAVKQSVHVKLNFPSCNCTRSFKNFQNEIIKQNKLNSRPFVKAKLSCVEQFRYP